MQSPPLLLLSNLPRTEIRALLRPSTFDLHNNMNNNNNTTTTHTSKQSSVISQPSITCSSYDNHNSNSNINITIIRKDMPKKSGIYPSKSAS